MNKLLRSIAFGLLGTAALAVASPADAAHGINHPGRHFMRTHPVIAFRHRFPHFTVHERAAWIGGHWWHGRHHGRLGWWWYANGGWFFYDAPVYPYPTYDSDTYYYDDTYDDEDSDYDRGPSSSSRYWFYCRDPQGYYPYIKTCKGDWQRVAPDPDNAYDRNRDDNDADRDGAGDDHDQDDDDRGPPPDDRHYDNGPDQHQGAMNNDNSSDDADDGDDDDSDNGGNADNSDGPPRSLSH